MIFITWLELTKYIILTLQRSQFICDAHHSKSYKDVKTQMAHSYVLYQCSCSKNATYTYWCFYNTNCIQVCWDTCLFGANTLLLSPILSYQRATSYVNSLSKFRRPISSLLSCQRFPKSLTNDAPCNMRHAVLIFILGYLWSWSNNFCDHFVTLTFLIS